MATGCVAVGSFPGRPVSNGTAARTRMPGTRPGITTVRWLGQVPDYSSRLPMSCSRNVNRFRKSR